MTSSIAPASYTEVFQNYYPLIRYYVAKARVPNDHVEDVSMILLEKFIEKGMLEQFDPERGVQFTTFFSGFITAYIRHYVERIRLSAYRELLLVDKPVSANEEEFSTWMDAAGFTHSDDTSRPEYTSLVESIRKHLASLPVRGKRNFLLLFDLIQHQMYERGSIYQKELAARFEVSPALMSGWMKMLAGHVREVPGL